MSARRLPKILALCLFLAGCSDPGGAAPARVSTETAEATQRIETGRRLLNSGYDMLNNLDDFSEDSLEGVEAALNQIVRRLNEGLAMVAADGPDAPQLDASTDGRILREVVWLRDASNFAVGSTTDPLRRAERLFDWTVRNIQLIPDDSEEAAMPRLPWHVMLFGRGTALERAWLFQLLARQQGLSVVLLQLPSKDVEKSPQFWCAGLLSQPPAEPAVHLFDSRLGVPISGPQGQGIATLEQATADDGLLRALDVEGHAYPFHAVDIKNLIALVDASSPYVEPRFARLGNYLAGVTKLTLAVDLDAQRSVLQTQAAVSETRAWPERDRRFPELDKSPFAERLIYELQPFVIRPPTSGDRLHQPPLWKARVRHLSGRYTDELAEASAAEQRSIISGLYHQARVSDELFEQSREEAVKQKVDAAKIDEALGLLTRTNRRATYWLALVAYDLRNYDTAAMYLEIILSSKVDAAWIAAARYNLGRIYEAQSASPAIDPAKRTELLKKAVETYQKPYAEVPADAQSLLRAKLLTTKPSIESTSN